MDPHECGTLRFSTHKVRTRIKKCVVNNASPEASRGQKETRHMDMQAGGSPILSTRLKDGMTTDSTVQPVPWWFDIYLRKESQRAEELEFLP